MLRSVMKTNRGGRLIQFKFQNMSTSPNGLSAFRKFLQFFGIDNYLKRFQFGHKAFGGVVLTTGTALCGIFYKGRRTLTEFLDDDDESSGNRFTVYLKENIKALERRYMISNGVGQGLAWLHYAEYLQYVLPDIENSIEKSEWYQKLSNDERKRIPMKLYEVIPRKCYIDITGNDDNIQYVEDINIDSKKKVKVKIYSIMDGQTKYYCICNCPKELKTMNQVNDIQKAGITHSKFSKYNLWSKDSTVQLFDVDTKLIQLMRFYFTLSSLLCRNFTGDVFKEKARIVLFNESHTKLSKALLQAIKEDLSIGSSDKTPNGISMHMKLQEAEYKDGSFDFNVRVSNLENAFGNQSGPSKHNTTETVLDNGSSESDKKKSNSIKKKNSKKYHRSLMETKLLSEEENMDIFYEFDVFVTRRKEEQNSNTNTNLEDINKELIAKKMEVLLEKECIGKDWLTKLKYAATKCRWIVFLDTNDCTKNNSLSDESANSKESRKLFASQNVAGSLKNILKSRKVQTVAVVNTKNELHILDDLRWVSCIPIRENTEFMNTVYKVVSGSEIKLKKSEELYFGPGEVAAGLAWHYAAYHLNKILPIMDEEVTHAADDQTKPLQNLKLLLIVPQSCKTSNYLSEAPPTSDQQIISSTGNKFPGELVEYTVTKPKKEPETFIGEYPKPVAVIRHMREIGLLNEKQMTYEVKEFYETVDRIMKILLPEKKNDYQFVYYNDKEKKLEDVLFEIYDKERFLDELRIKLCTDNTPF